jgi:hypothetical protein
VAAPKRIEMAEKRKSFTNGFMAVLLKMMACWPIHVNLHQAYKPNINFTGILLRMFKRGNTTT